MAKKLKKEDLELMSYNDIAYLLLKNKQKVSTLDLFKQIVELLELSNDTLESKIGDFYTALTKDKRFTLLEDGTWDLQENYKAKKLSDDEDLEDFEEDLEDYDDEEVEKEDEMFDNEDNDDDISDITDEYKNLVIVDEDELDQE